MFVHRILLLPVGWALGNPMSSGRLSGLLTGGSIRPKESPEPGGRGQGFLGPRLCQEGPWKTCLLAVLLCLTAVFFLPCVTAAEAPRLLPDGCGSRSGVSTALLRNGHWVAKEALGGRGRDEGGS